MVRPSPPLQASLLMLVTCICFSIMSAVIRDLSNEISPFQIAFVRNLVGIIILFPIMLKLGFQPITGSVYRAYGIRACVGICAMWAWYSALSLTPLAEAVTLSFTTSLWMIPVAILLLGEKVGIRRWVATIVGFIGVLIVLQPASQNFNSGSLLALLSALLFAVSMALVKLLAKSERPVEIVFYMNIFMIPLSIGPAIIFWSPPTYSQWYSLCFIGVASACAHFFMARALATVDASALMPLDFTRLPFAVAIGYIVFGEIPTIWIWPGALLIAASALYIARREARLYRLRHTKASHF